MNNDRIGLNQPLVKLRLELTEAQKQLEAKDAEIAALKEQSQGYYNEASEGWAKFRRAETEIERLRKVVEIYLQRCPMCNADMECHDDLCYAMRAALKGQNE